MFDNRSKFVEHYTGLDDIPDEYRISNVRTRDEKTETRSILAAIKQFQSPRLSPTRTRRGLPMRNGRPRANLALRALPRPGGSPGPPGFPDPPGGKEAVCRNMVEERTIAISIKAAKLPGWALAAACKKSLRK